VLVWARDHRVHHKYSETDADPHNAKRGFFFSHIGWLLCRKHPEVKKKGKKIDISDLENDPVLAFQKKYDYETVLVKALFIGRQFLKRIYSFQLLCYTDAADVLYFTYCNPSNLLERDMDKLLFHSHHFPLRLYVERNMVGKLCGSSLRQQTLR
jgi:fatty-acid desaturase